ncbi:EamA family transporter [Lysobacter sp. A6]|uniref:EamA family transporter n=1 Tax=Noviluteimonas lactosilytica TaxID=2888523 RepID=A0ABS8JJP9_9GAMM|nr:EamA family transporter [Lysobacter lactosilyticus]MCC8363833.1 EamA family transporter [Lysobacter lactosilyticus]
MNTALILVSVAMICAGQLLFKLVGQKLAAGAPALSMQVLAMMTLAMGIYGTATLLWVYVLKSVPLTKAYPFMALSFVAVPALSVLFLSERVTPQYVIGAALIVCGVILAVRA